MKTAIITGVNGQDGSYLAELLLEKKYRVIGLYRRSSTNTFSRIKNIVNLPNFFVEEFDITDATTCNFLINKYKPDELYNLAAMSHVGTSFNQPNATFQINTGGVINLLESVRNYSPYTRFYQASTSEMFGSNYTTRNGRKFQDENTPFLPQSPYATAKLAAHKMVEIYREAYGIYSCAGILYNHEGPRRGENFVTRKITKYIGNLENNRLGEDNKLRLGNLKASRDWGHSKDFVLAMWLILQQDKPEDFVIGTGETHTVSEFLEKAFLMINKDYMDYVVIDKDLYRPCEVDYLCADYSKAKDLLGWSPKISFDMLVEEMVNNDIMLAYNQKDMEYA